jgi:hypothetical protein
MAEKIPNEQTGKPIDHKNNANLHSPWAAFGGNRMAHHYGMNFSYCSI